MKFHKDGTRPKQGQIFVFGSNLSGVHGAGAARYAYQQLGAVYGKSYGLMGQSYACPTKDKDIVTLPLAKINIYVNAFLKYARNHPQTEFFVTRIGCVLAGYDDSQIAVMFKHSPPNCSFAREWKPFLVNP